MRVIVNLSTPKYHIAQARLKQSLSGYDTLYVDFQAEDEVGAPMHRNNPYAFKVHTMEQLHTRGFDQVLWLDSSCYAVADPVPLFEIMETKGYFMEEAGHMAGKWANDRCLRYFGLTRDAAMEIPMYSAGFTGLDFNHEVSKQFFKMWKQAMLDGAFKGAWTNKNRSESADPRCEGHRHDMVCASIIAHKLGMTFEKGGSYFQYAAPDEPVAHDKIIFKLQGI